MNPDEKTNTTRIVKYLRWLWLPVIAAALFYYLWIVNPLPSDEQMIENFKAHRADFVEAVRRYRNYPRLPNKDTSRWYKEGDTLEIYKRAGIDRIYYSTPIWLPNPYSIETAKCADSLVGFAYSYKYGALKIVSATTPRINHPDQSDDSGYRRNTLLHGVIWKDYYYFPEVPRIENGYLHGPIYPNGNFSFCSRVLPSLNRLPFPWKDFECVYRQIEPQWFLCMCNGH